MEKIPTSEVMTAALDLLDTCLGKHSRQRWLLVDVHQQHLWLLKEMTPQTSFPVSTAAVGLDNRQDSGGTPPGVHRIAQKIGQDAQRGTIFVNREPTGAIWQPGQSDDEDLILTRILTLVGCESGVNLGDSIDSRDRFIYLHGTNHEDKIGQPVSHGCVRLSNADICHLFDRVCEGDPVVIV